MEAARRRLGIKSNAEINAESRATLKAAKKAERAGKHLTSARHRLPLSTCSVPPAASLLRAWRMAWKLLLRLDNVVGKLAEDGNDMLLS